MRYADSDEFRLLCAKADELIKRAKGDIFSTAFLSPTEQYFLSRELKKQGNDGRTLFFGGARGAQRRKMFALPEYIAAMANDDTAPYGDAAMLAGDAAIANGDLYSTAIDFLGDTAFADISVLKIAGGGFRDFTHRDYLGSLLALGIDRSALGDIAPIDEYSAYVFVSCKVSGFLLDGDFRIANDRVKITRAVLPDNYEIKQSFKSVTDTVASSRLDCVTAALCNLSRESAKDKIIAKEVEHNYDTAYETDEEVVAGDIISVRGVGKFRIDSIADVTKKGRLRLCASKFV